MKTLKTAKRDTHRNGFNIKLCLLTQSYLASKVIHLEIELGHFCMTTNCN